MERTGLSPDVDEMIGVDDREALRGRDPGSLSIYDGFREWNPEVLSRCGNVVFLVLPYSKKLNGIPPPCFAPGVKFCNIDRELRLPTSLLSQRLIGLCGPVGSGKTTITNIWTRQIWPGRLKKLPEARSAEERALRTGEVLGEDIVLYDNNDAFLQAIENGEFIAAWCYGRQIGGPMHLAGIRKQELRQVVQNRLASHVLLANGLIWSALAHCIPGLHAFCVETTEADYQRMKEKRGMAPEEGESMTDYGFHYSLLDDVRRGLHIPGICRLPNGYTSDPEVALCSRFRDPLVREYLERTGVFWAEGLRRDVRMLHPSRTTYPDRELPMKYIFRVLAGEREPNSHPELKDRADE